MLPMLTISAVVAFATIVAILLRTRHLTVGPAIAASLFGFFLASTGIAPGIESALSSIVNALTNLTS